MHKIYVASIKCYRPLYYEVVVEYKDETIFSGLATVNVTKDTFVGIYKILFEKFKLDTILVYTNSEYIAEKVCQTRLSYAKIPLSSTIKEITIETGLGVFETLYRLKKATNT